MDHPTELEQMSQNDSHFRQESPALAEPENQASQESDPSAILDLVELEAEPPAKLEGVVIGTLAGFSERGQCLVDFPFNSRGNPLPAIATTRPDPTAIGSQVALMFVEGDPCRPMLMGLILNPEPASPPVADLGGSPLGTNVQVEADGERLTFTAKKEIMFRCGKASICLTEAGKVIIRGAYLLNRSSGVNRIKGASVQIN